MRDVQADNWCVGIGSRSIFGPLSFTVLRNTTMAVVGPGGSGKSTLLKALAGKLPAEMWMRGELFVAPEHVAFLSQKSYPQANGEGEEESFAPGSRQSVDPGLRMAHFRSVVETSARILLLDEPDARLPASYYDAIERELHRIRGQKTVILVTHHLELVKHISDWMLLLIDGEVIEQGETGQLFRSPQRERTVQFIRMGS